jgi:hypothetical protein
VVTLWLDGRRRVTLTVRKSAARVERVRLGAVGSARGTLHLDDYVTSRRSRGALVGGL